MTAAQRNPQSDAREIFIPSRIVSGGQTGVDRAGLEAAIALGIQHGGWCPAGRLAEDGTVPSRYTLKETDAADYPTRTRQNVIDSDATLIIYEGKLKGGTLLTRRICKQTNKLCQLAKLERDDVARVQQWLAETKPQTLNVAGPRESTADGIEERALEFLLRVFSSNDDS